MSFSPSEVSIVQMFEELSMSPQEIASDLDYEESSIKIILASKSKKYREECFSKETKELKTSERISENSSPLENNLFTKDDVDLARAAIIELVSSGENEGVRLKAAKSIIDESLGRNDKKTFKNLEFNITFLNETIQNARRAREAARNKVIDLRPEDVKMLAMEK